MGRAAGKGKDVRVSIKFNWELRDPPVSRGGEAQDGRTTVEVDEGGGGLKQENFHEAVVRLRAGCSGSGGGGGGSRRQFSPAQGNRGGGTREDTQGWMELGRRRPSVRRSTAEEEPKARRN